MATLPELVTQALVDLRAVTASLLGLEGRVQAKFDANTNNVTTIIQQFNTRPLYTYISVDPVNGLDTNDGSLAKPMRTLDAALAGIGSQGVTILLFEDDIIRKRHTINTNIQILGVQRSANAAGFIGFRRYVSFIGTAENSPSLLGDTFSSGIYFAAGSIFTGSIIFKLPDVPSGLGTREHLVSTASITAQMINMTLVVDAPTASALFGSYSGGRIIATIDALIGAGATGHIFGGVAAGADPNALWSYSTNLKSA